MTGSNDPTSPRPDSGSHRPVSVTPKGEPGSQPSLRRFAVYVKAGTQPIPTHLVAEVHFPSACDPDTIGTVTWIDPENLRHLDWLSQKLDPPSYAKIYNLIRRSNGITWLVIGYWKL